MEAESTLGEQAMVVGEGILEGAISSQEQLNEESF